MASQRTKFSSVRVYRRWCLGAILSGLASLGIAAVFAAVLLLPLFSLTVGEEVLNRTGLDFVYFGLRDFVPNLYDKKLDDFLAVFDLYKESGLENQLLMTISNIHNYIELGLMGVFAVATVFAAIIGILGLFWILTGRIHYPKSAFTLSKFALIFYALFIGLLYLYFFFYQELIKGLEMEGVTTQINILPVIFIAVLLGLVIVLGVTHSIAFKDRVFARKKKSLDELNEDFPDYDYTENRNNSPIPAVAPVYQGVIQVPVAARPAVVNGRIPQDIKDIGNHAFSKNSKLQIAYIPNGITTIGDSAFSNCINLEMVSIPLSVKYIGYNCFFNTPKLKKIVYLGTRKQWQAIVKGSNYLMRSGVRVLVTTDGRMYARVIKKQAKVKKQQPAPEKN